MTKPESKSYRYCLHEENEEFEEPDSVDEPPHPLFQDEESEA